MSQLSRRDFLRLIAAGAGSAAATQFLAACGQAAETAAPSPTTAPPAYTAVPPTLPAPTATPAPTSSAALVARRPEIIKMFPQFKSQVIYTHHAGVWSGKTLQPDALRKMLDASITKLTGVNDAQEAWKALFSPDEKIAIKVNAFYNSKIWTHVPLVSAVTASLMDAGIPAEQIIIYDATSNELKEAGFTINKDGPGVRVYGNDRSFGKAVKMGYTEQGVSNILLGCDALINIPVLKAHMIAGMTFALKNHFGSIPIPGAMHTTTTSIPQLNVLPDIKDRTRLVIGDALEANLKYGNSYPYWVADYQGDGLFMSYDPVATDSVGFDVFSKLVTDSGGNIEPLKAWATPWLKNSEAAGIGGYSPENREMVELNL